MGADGLTYKTSSQKQSVADEEIFTIRKADRSRLESEAQIAKLKVELLKVQTEKQTEYDQAAKQIAKLKKEIEMVIFQNFNTILVRQKSGHYIRTNFQKSA